ncbi:MAG: glycosyltransferase family 4 protein [Chloroflexi bacterium]|nr:glycosyltransferase family 4 protein [Chloroflexota bacterium]
MKIAHIAPPWIAIPPKNYGGTEAVIYHLVEEQVAQGHEVTLFAPGDAKTSARLVSFFQKSLADTGVPWQAHLKAYYHYCKAVEFIREHNFDILHTHLSSASDIYLFPLTARLACPHVMTLHSRFPFDRVGQWTGDADEYYMEWASLVPMVAISERARDDVPYTLNFVGVVHHGVPMAQFKPTVKQPENFFAWLGRIMPEKGAHLAIQAAKEGGVPLVLAGTVDCHLPEAVDYFEQKVKPQIDNQEVKYIGPVNMEQKIDLLSRARGLLNPIEWEEPFGMVMIEAMAVGCPVITFARGAAGEVVAHGKSGFLVQNVNEMVQYIANIGKLDRDVVRTYAEQNFSARVMAEKYVSIYKKVIVSSALQSAASARPTIARLPVKTSSKALAPVEVLYKSTQTVRAEREWESTS